MGRPSLQQRVVLSVSRWAWQCKKPAERDPENERAVNVSPWLLLEFLPRFASVEDRDLEMLAE